MTCNSEAIDKRRVAELDNIRIGELLLFAVAGFGPQLMGNTPLKGLDSSPASRSEQLHRPSKQRRITKSS